VCTLGGSLLESKPCKFLESVKVSGAICGA
jgi:hypothetical protein